MHSVSKNRIVELDGLRGVAILLVISFHYINNQLIHTTNTIGKALGFITSFGWVGVDLFFVLSGFLICSILLENKYSNNFFSTFFLRRVLRILPNYYFFLLLFFLPYAFGIFNKSTFLFSRSEVPVWSYFSLLSNFFMASNETMGVPALSITWSICIEEQFYLVFPIIIFFLRRRLIPYFLIFVIIVSPIIRLSYGDWIPRYVLLVTRMDSIAFGALVAYFYQFFDFKSSALKIKLILYVLILVDITICGLLYWFFKDLGVAKHSLFGLFFAFILWLIISVDSLMLKSVLRNNLLMQIGRMSYSLYLFHYFFLGLFYLLFSQNNYIGIGSINDVVITIFALIFSIVFSWFIFHRIESPFVNYGKKITY